MAITEGRFFVTNSYGDGIAINERDGEYSLVSAKKTSSGLYMQWCKMQVNRDEFSEKSFPMGTPRCSKEKLIDALEFLHSKLSSSSQDVPGPIDDNEPFK